MNVSEITLWIGAAVLALYVLNQLYIVIRAMAWRSQDKLIARALERRDV